MTHESITTLPPAEVLHLAKRFFTERVPHNAAFPEKEGAGYLTMRGQGGEELVLSVMTVPEGTRIRASTLFFDQAIDRFLSTLPVPAGVVA